MNIALIGLRCAGKSTIGKLLAHALGRRFVDLDDQTLAEFDAATITKVWQLHGESGWRGAELKALADVLAEDDAVVALGGGTPMIPAAKQLIEAKTQAGALRVIYLACDSDVLVQRREVIDRDDRPKLFDESIEQEIERTQRQRGPTFAALADFTLDVSAMTADEAAAQLLARLQLV